MKTYTWAEHMVRKTSESIIDGLTYLHRGSRVNAQIIALMPPMTSSFGGTGPVAGHKPLRVYNGEVPMSE